MRAATFRTPSALPGFGLAFGITMTMLSLLVIIPIGALLLRGVDIGAADVWKTIHTERVWTALRLSFGVSLLAALFNLVFGLALAWVLARYRFPGKRLVDAAVDLPFALPTAVAGIALTALYAPNGAFGQLLAPLGIKVAYTPLGIFVALVFVSLPFVVRTVQPVIEEIEREVEEASATLGAGRLADLPTGDPADADAGAADRLRAGAGAGGRGVRLGDLHRRQPAVPERDRAAAHRHQARGVRLRRGGGDRDRDAGDLVRDAPRDQPRPGLEQKEARKLMADIACHAGIAELRRHSRAATTEPDWLRIALIAAVLGMLVIVLFAPLVAVFSQALAKGFGEAVASFANPDVRSAIKLTLIVAAIAVPLNAAFGVAAAWAIAKFDFRGKAFLITFIDLPFSVSPVVAGLCFVLLFGAQGLRRLVADRARA